MSADQKNASEVSMDLAALGDIVERFAGKKIILFGDFVADEFQSGEISRVSREAPVLILRHRGTTMAPGGGANALAWIRAASHARRIGLRRQKRDSSPDGRIPWRSKCCESIASRRSRHRKRSSPRLPQNYKRRYGPRMEWRFRTMGSVWHRRWR